MVSIIKKMTDVLVSDKQLYDECGVIFTYLNELKINFSNIEYHNIAWQYSQVIEIVYSNKLENINLNIFDVIIGFANENHATTKVKQLISANFDTTIFISDYRKNNPIIKYSLFDNISDELLNYPCYKKMDKKKNIVSEYNVLTNYEKEVFEKLINSTYSNNGLYFVGFFIYLHMKFNSTLPILNVNRSLLVNLYLMKTKLLFAPTLCISYPLYHNHNEFLYSFQEVNDDPKEIIKFSRLCFDIIKQAAIINRAFVSKAIVTYSLLEEIISKNKVLKILENKPYKNLFKILAFDKNMLKKYLEINDISDVLLIIDELIRLNLIVNISNRENQDFYMFKELFKAIKRLDRNKSQSTAQIFKLRENMN